MPRKGWNVFVADVKSTLVPTVRFVIRFTVIMSLMYLSAVMFAYLEEPELDRITKCAKEEGSSTLPINATYFKSEDNDSGFHIAILFIIHHLGA